MRDAITVAAQTFGSVMLIGEAPWLSELFAREGYAVCALAPGAAAPQLVAERQPDVIVIVEGERPAAVMGCCAELRDHPSTFGLPVVVASTRYRRDAHTDWIVAGADDYLCTLFDVIRLLARVRALVDWRRRQAGASGEQPAQVALALLGAVAAHRPEEADHMRRVAALALRLGRRLGLAGDELARLYFGALLHDLGKVAVDRGLLGAAAPLTPAQRAAIRQHPVVGEQILGPLSLGRAIGPIVRWHHERLDGSGYPDGLVGEAIPWAARVVAVLDAYDAMTSPRPYQELRSPHYAIAELAAARHLWDVALVRALAELLRVPFPREEARAVGERYAA